MQNPEIGCVDSVHSLKLKLAECQLEQMRLKAQLLQQSVPSAEVDTTVGNLVLRLRERLPWIELYRPDGSRDCSFPLPTLDAVGAFFQQWDFTLEENALRQSVLRSKSGKPAD